MKNARLWRWLAVPVTVGCTGLAVAWMMRPAHDGAWRKKVLDLLTGKPTAPTVPKTCADLLDFVVSECDGFVATQGTWRMRFRPAELAACKDGPTTPISTLFSSGERTSEEYVLEIPVDEIERMGAGAFMAYLNRDLQQVLSMSVDGDTLRCDFVHVEAGPSFSPVQRLIIGFDRKPDGADRAIIIKGGSGPLSTDVRFDFAPGAFARYTSSLRAIADQTTK